MMIVRRMTLTLSPKVGDGIDPAQLHANTCAAALSFFDSDGAAIAFDDLPNDCQAQPCAARGSIAGRLQSVKRLEDLGTIFRRDARSTILDT